MSERMNDKEVEAIRNAYVGKSHARIVAVECLARGREIAKLKAEASDDYDEYESLCDTLKKRAEAAESALAAKSAEVDELRRDHVGLMNVSGALMDAGTIPVPNRPEDYGKAVRKLTAERDAKSDEVEGFRREDTDLRDANVKLSAEVKALRKERDELRGGMEAIERGAKLASSGLSGKCEKCGSAYHLTDQHEDLSKRLEETVRQLDGAVRHTQTVNKCAEDRLAAAEARAEKAETEVEALRSRNLYLERVVADAASWFERLDAPKEVLICKQVLENSEHGSAYDYAKHIRDLKAEVEALRKHVTELEGGPCEECGGSGIERWLENDGTDEGQENQGLCSGCGGAGFDLISRTRAEALEYVASLIRSRKALPNLAVSYLAALSDMDVHVGAAISRISRGERMQATTVVDDALKPSPMPTGHGVCKFCGFPLPNHFAGCPEKPPSPKETPK